METGNTVKILVAITLPGFCITDEAVDLLRARCLDLHIVHARDDATALREVAGAEVAFSSHLPRGALAQAAELRWVHTPAAGVTNLLSPEMIASPIQLTNSRGLHTGIAEHVLAVLLALHRRLHLAVRRQVEHVWAQREFTDIPTVAGHRMLVVGLGRIGTAVADLASALGVRVSAVRRHPDRPKPAGVDEVFGPDGLHDALGVADFVVIAAPSTRATDQLFGARELKLMKRSAYLINVARGRLINQDELVEALTLGTIAGAGLDVFAEEPLDPASPFWDLPNALITPHTAGFRPDLWIAATELFLENLARYRRGDPLVNQVDKEAGY